jgi:hypothetical protein
MLADETEGQEGQRGRRTKILFASEVSSPSSIHPKATPSISISSC